MKEIIIDEMLLLLAEKRSKKLGKLKNSFTGGKGNIWGFLGEGIFGKYMGILPDNTYHFDFRIQDHKVDVNHKVDVKAKHCKTEPMRHYECSIAKESKFQETDLYVFTRILEDCSKGWILGYISKKEYFDMATFHTKGEIDIENSFVFKNDCYNLPISCLKPINELKGAENRLDVWM